MSILVSTQCCGVMEAHGIGEGHTPHESLKRMLSYNGQQVPSCAHITFTSVERDGLTYGRDFADFIKSSHLGTITEGAVCPNPNTSNNVKVWIWHLDRDALKAWWGKHATTYIQPPLPSSAPAPSYAPPAPASSILDAVYEQLRGIGR